jgi:Ca2+-binding EF-hand superfamily protein/predicted DNA binding CopG/RHH family protein
MFQALDMNSDCLVCAKDLSLWQTQHVVARSSLSKLGSSHDPEASPHELHLDEILAFLRVCGASHSVDLMPYSIITRDLRKTGEYRKKKVFFEDNDDLTPAQCVESDAFSEEGLAACLALFPTLAFDWTSPLNCGSSRNTVRSERSGAKQSHLRNASFNREMAATWFSRIDTNSDGWITAADLRVWRRMLPLGRSENKLVLSFIPMDTDANEAAAKVLRSKTAPLKALMRRRSSLFTLTAVETQAQSSGSTVDEVHPEIVPGLKPWEFYMVLREDPMLTAEICAQVALLDFIMSGGPKDVNSADIFGRLNVDGAVDGNDFIAKLEIKDIDNTKGSDMHAEKAAIAQDACLLAANDVPSDTMISAFVCVAKLKLHRLANAYDEANALRDRMAASVLCALDTARCGYVSVHDVQKYLQVHANLYSVSKDDMLCFLNEDYGLNNGTTYEVAEDDGEELGQLLDQDALRKVLSRPAFGKFARLLYRFVQFQQELTSRQHQAVKTRQGNAGGESLRRKGASDVSSNRSPKRMTIKERIAVRRAAMLTEEQNFRKIDCSTATSSVASTGRRKCECSTTISADGTERRESVPMFTTEENQKLPPGFGQVALQKWFKELDADGDGFVTCCDVRTWCAAASCQHLVDEADLESLFQTTLPNFTGPPIEALHKSTGDLTSTSARVQRVQSRPCSTTNVPQEFSEDNLSTSHGDVDFIARFTPVKMADLPVSGSLNEVELAVALARWPTLAAQLFLIRRVSRAIQLMLLAEACAAAALTAAATAATAADWAASAPPDQNQRARVLAMSAKSTAQQAAARARSAIAEVVASCAPSGRHHMKYSGRKNNETADLDLAAKVEEAEASETQRITDHSARRALQDHLLLEARRNVTRVTIEVALEVKLLAWRKVEHYPDQIHELRALMPLSAAGPMPLTANVDAFVPEVNRAVEENAVAPVNAKTMKRMVPLQKRNFKAKLVRSFLASPSENFNRMVFSLDNDEIGTENGAPAKDEGWNTRSWNIHDTASGTSLDYVAESRLSVRHRKITSTTRKPPPKPQHRKRFQKTTQPSSTEWEGVNTTPISSGHTAISISVDARTNSSSTSPLSSQLSSPPACSSSSSEESE